MGLSVIDGFYFYIHRKNISSSFEELDYIYADESSLIERTTCSIARVTVNPNEKSSFSDM